MTSEETLRSEHILVAASAANLFFGSQDSYRQGYLHDLRRENDQKNSCLNKDFENGDFVLKKWFNTRVNNFLLVVCS